MRVIIAGATGLVGALAADRLLAATEHEIHALVRRPTGRDHPRWREEVASPEHWPRLVAELRPDAAVSALGTTMRAAGSREAFRAVDYDLLLAVARAAREAGARRMTAISSVGAAAGARSFYLAVKGEAEDALRALGFDRLDLLRPGLLLGERRGEPRPGERLAIALSPLTDRLLRGFFARYRSIPARLVARAVPTCLSRPAPGVFVHENDAIRRLARYE